MFASISAMTDNSYCSVSLLQFVIVNILELGLSNGYVVVLYIEKITNSVTTNDVEYTFIT